MDSADEPLAETTSLCPTCLERVPGRYVAENGSVHLERDCPEHGTASRTVWDSVDHWEWAGDRGPDPDPDGDLVVENSHACLAVVEVTERCNLSCSYCFASSGPAGRHRSFEEVVHLLDVVRRDGGPRPIQFSGGEPTVREDLPELVEAAVGRGFSHVQINTNGLVLAREDGYAERLVEAGVTAVYLQFDGLQSATYEAIREVDILEEKHAAIEACRRAALPVVLVPTVVPGVNDDEMGAIVEFALDNRDVVRSVNFQPVAHFGRYAEHHGRFSLDAAAGRLADQIEPLEVDDFLPVPCCSGYCQMGTALVPAGDVGPVGTEASSDGGADVVPVTSFLDTELAGVLLGTVDEADWLEFLAGTPVAGDRADALTESGAVDGSAGAGCCGPEASLVGDCCGGGLPAGTGDLLADGDAGLVDGLLDTVLPVTLTGFMDADAADVGRLNNCCIAVPTPDGDLVPFCGYNMTTEDGRYALRTRHGWGGRQAVDAPAADAGTAEQPGD